MILEHLKVLLEGDTTGLAGAFRKLAAGVTAGAVFHKIVEESTEAQYAMAQLEAAVESTGGAAGKSVDELDDLSNALERETTFSDEAIKSAESLLLTFTKVQGGTFDRATRTVLDLASAMGGDLKGSAVQLGKALNDPVQGITALTRVGVTFSDSQKAVIKNLVETNRLGEAQGIILDELEREFGGSATAARDTLGGALQALGNQWGNLFEVSRENSGGIIDAINGIGDAIPHVRDLVNGFLQGVQRAGSLAAVAWEKLKLAFLEYMSTSEEFMGDRSELQARIDATRVSIGRLEEAADEVWDEIVTGGPPAAASVAHVGAAFDDAAGAADRMTKAWSKAQDAALLEKIKPGGKEAGGSAAEEASETEQALAKLKDQTLDVDKSVDQLTATTIDFAEVGLDAILGFATGSKDAFGNFVDFAVQEIQRLLAKLLIVEALKAVIGGGTGGIGAAILGALEGRAAGGPVSGGRPYIVGERGPELFVPATAGAIVPNGAGGGITAAQFLAALGPLPRPQTPREVSRDAWWREAIEHLDRQRRERS